jgi:hypothetical protein
MNKKRRSIECKADPFINKYIKERSELIENSQSRVLSRILEHLAKSDKEIKRILDTSKKVRTIIENEFARRPVVPQMLKRKDIPSISPTEEDIVREFLPRLTSARLYLDFSTLKGDPISLARSCVEPSTLNHFYPIWAEPFESHTENSYWLDWTSKSSSEAWCITGVNGRGHLQDELVANTATWAWDFSAGTTEELDIWFQHSVRGPCVWRTDGGDVSLWILFEVYVDKWIPPESGTGWMTAEEVASIPYHICRLYSTNASLAMNGPPPEPNFVPGCPTCALALNPREGHIRVQVEEGFSYTVYSGLTVALAANEHAAISVGSLAGANFDPCKFRGNCMICRCT